MSHSIVRRKIAARQSTEADGRPGADRAFRLAFARAMRDEMQLSVEVDAVDLQTNALGDVLESLPEKGLIMVLDGPEGVLGLMVLSNAALSALIEVQTMGAIQIEPGPMRRPTRTDAAIVTAVMDRILSEMDQLLADEADLVWAGGYRFASFLEDARPLGLLLDDTAYRRIHATVRLGGRRDGQVVLALQAREGAGLSLAHHEAEDGKKRAHFSRELAGLVVETQVGMEAVIGRITLSIADIMDLRVGQALAMPQAGIDRISLESVDGRRVALGKLGQNRGLRALRLTEVSTGAAGLSPNGSKPVQAPPAIDRAAALVVETQQPLQKAG